MLSLDDLHFGYQLLPIVFYITIAASGVRKMLYCIYCIFRTPLASFRCFIISI